MSAVSLRPFRSIDQGACLALFDANVPRFFAARERGDFAVFLARAPSRYWVMQEDAGAIIGCGGYEVDRATRRAGLCWGMLRPDRHGQGLGRRLLDYRLGQLRAEADLDCVEIDTSQHSAGFFQRAGFQLFARETDGYGPGLDRLELRLSL